MKLGALLPFEVALAREAAVRADPLVLKIGTSTLVAVASEIKEALIANGHMTACDDLKTVLLQVTSRTVNPLPEVLTVPVEVLVGDEALKHLTLKDELLQHMINNKMGFFEDAPAPSKADKVDSGKVVFPVPVDMHQAPSNRQQRRFDTRKQKRKERKVRRGHQR